LARQLDRLEEIGDLLCRYANFHAGNPGLACTYAEFLIKVGRDAEARERLETVLLLSPGHEGARELLGGLDREGKS